MKEGIVWNDCGVCEFSCLHDSVQRSRIVYVSQQSIQTSKRIQTRAHTTELPFYSCFIDTHSILYIGMAENVMRNKHRQCYWTFKINTEKNVIKFACIGCFKWLVWLNCQNVLNFCWKQRTSGKKRWKKSVHVQPLVNQAIEFSLNKNETGIDN